MVMPYGQPMPGSTLAPEKDFISMVLGDQYAPGLPDAAPKPAGYWAAEAVRGGPITTAGIPFGMLGSALQAFTENVPMRIGSMAGQAVASLPLSDEQLKWMGEQSPFPFMGPAGIVSPTVRWLGGLAQAAREQNPPPWGDPSVFTGAAKKIGAGPIEEQLATMGFDPTMLLQFGPNVARGAAKAIGLGSTGQNLAVRGSELMDLPGKLAMQGATSAVQGLGRGVEAGGAAIGAKFPNAPRFLREPLKQAPASEAGETMKEVADAILQSPSYFQALDMPLEGAGRYSIPQFPGSWKPDIDAARRNIGRAYQNLENQILSPFSPEETIRNFRAYEAMQMAKSHGQGSLMDSLSRDLSSSDSKEVQEALGAYNAWYDTSMRNIDTLAQMFVRPQPGMNSVPMTMPAIVGHPVPGGPAVNTDLLRDIVTKYRGGQPGIPPGLIDTVLKDVREGVGYLRGGPGGMPLVPPGVLKPAVNDLYAYRNSEIIRLTQDAIDEIAQNFGIPADKVDELTGMASAEFRDRLNSLRAQAVGGPVGAGFMPSRLRDAMSEVGSIFLPHVQRIQGQRHRLAQELRGALQLNDPSMPDRNLPLGELWRTLNERLQVAGQQPLAPLGTATSDQLMNALSALQTNGLADAGSIRNVANILESWNTRGDLLTGNPLQLALGPTESALERAKSGADALKRDPAWWSQTKSGFQTFRQMMRESWLANPGYLLANVTSALGVNFFESPKAAIDGVQNLQEMMQNYAMGMKSPGLMNDLDLIPKSVANDLKTWGYQAVPTDWSVGGYIANNMQSVNEARTAMERTQWWKRAGFFALTAPVDLVGAALHTAVGTVAMPSISRATRNLAQISESAVRMALGHDEMVKYVDNAFHQFARETVDNVLNGQTFRDSVRTGGVGPGTFDTPFTPAVRGGIMAPYPQPVTAPFLSNLRTWFTTTGPHFSPQQLMDKMVELGVHTDDAMIAGQQWSELLDQGLQAGTALANKRHVDYSKFTNLEAAIDQLAPFTRWAIRMMPNFRDIIAQVPGFIINVQRLNSITSKEAEELGLSDRYKRMISTGSLGKWVSERLFGKPGGQVYIDPARVFMPWTNVQAAAQDAQFAGGPVEAITNLMPWKPYPELQAVAQAGSNIAGSLTPQLQPFLPFSPESPIPTLSRVSPLAGLWGGNTGEIQQTLQQQLPFNNSFDYRRADIQRKLGENAAVDTGHPDHPLYLAARGLESGPLYEQAAGQIGRERAFENALSLMLPVSVQAVRPEEIAARQAARNLPTGRRETPEKQEAFDQALRANPWVAAHQGVQGSDINSRLQYVFNVMRNPAMLFPSAHPEVATQLAKDLVRYDSLPGGNAQNSAKMSNPLIGAALQARHQFLASYPEGKAYLYWRQQLHPSERQPDEASMMEQFIKWYRGGGRPPKDWQG